MARKSEDALAEAEAEEAAEVMKWKIMFCGQKEWWRTERIAAMEPRR